MSVPGLPERFDALLRTGRVEEAADLPVTEVGDRMARGIARSMLGRDDEARADFDACRELGPWPEIELAFLDVRERRDVAGAAATARRVLAAAETEPHVRARAWHALGLAEGKLRRTQASTDALLQARELYRRSGDRGGLAQVRDTLGALMASLGRLDVAAVHFLTSIVDKAIAGDRIGMALTLGQMGRAQLRAGRFAEARECFDLDLEISRDLGDQRGEVRMLVDLGRTSLDADELPRAVTELEHAARVAAARGMQDLESFARMDLARALARAERPRDAERELDRAAALRPGRDDPYDQALLESAQGELAWRSRNRACIPLLESAARRLAALDVPDVEIPVLLLLAEALLHWGDRLDDRPAETCILRALRFANEDGYARFLPAIRQALLALELSIGAADESRPIQWSDLAPRTDVEGARRTGEFIFIQNLGTGSFGTTWRAYDARRNVLVAVKRLKLDDLYDPATRQLVLTSARMELLAASRIRHPGIARVLEIGDDTHGGTYVVQEFVPGRNLRDVMRDTDRVPLEIALGAAADVARALAALHESGTVHRDLKPENILLRSDGLPHTPVLIDFGLAQRIHAARVGPDAFLAGTAEYVSPEQALGERVGPPTDVWALGVVLYEWLTGVAPFQLGHVDRADFPAIGAQLARQRVRPLRELRPDVPEQLAQRIERVFQRGPDERPGALELAEACDHAARRPA